MCSTFFGNNLAIIAESIRPASWKVERRSPNRLEQMVFCEPCRIGVRRSGGSASECATLETSHFSLWLFGLPSCPMTLNEQMTRLARQARVASRELAQLTTAEKNSCLLAMAAALEKNADAIKSFSCAAMALLLLGA